MYASAAIEAIQRDHRVVEVLMSHIRDLPPHKQEFIQRHLNNMGLGQHDAQRRHALNVLAEHVKYEDGKAEPSLEHTLPGGLQIDGRRGYNKFVTAKKEDGWAWCTGDLEWTRGFPSREQACIHATSRAVHRKRDLLVELVDASKGVLTAPDDAYPLIRLGRAVNAWEVTP